MLTEKELVLLKQLRQNSRKSLADINKETKIPVSTLFDKLRKLESSIILKHVSLLDFPKLGYSLKVNIIISSRQKQKLKEFLMNNKNVNSLCSLMGNYDLCAECVFKDLKEVVAFRENIEKFQINKSEEIFVVDELKREGFQIS